MVIYLIRHTTPDIEPGVCYGQSDLSLVESFEGEAQKVKASLHASGVSDDAVFVSSPLQRCHRLASSLTDQKVDTDDRLMEMNFGDWEMQKWDDIDPVALRRWTDDFVEQSCPGGESYRELYARVVGFIDDLQSNNHENVVIVTHGGVIRSVLTYLGESTLETSFEVSVEYGDVFKRELGCR